jgi:hypothetical protein
MLQEVEASLFYGHWMLLGFLPLPRRSKLHLYNCTGENARQ